ncbi:hypothetical protein [Cupriavidus sp. TMH.W2]|uniref:hypothetical protein n=1 Tax=Cupriavidus sp. TMH.W2 TaxID=3434465 RepID=UPI003D7820D0
MATGNKTVAMFLVGVLGLASAAHGDESWKKEIGMSCKRNPSPSHVVKIYAQSLARKPWTCHVICPYRLHGGITGRIEATVTVEARTKGHPVYKSTVKDVSTVGLVEFDCY